MRSILAEGPDPAEVLGNVIKNKLYSSTAGDKLIGHVMKKDLSKE